MHVIHLGKYYPPARGGMETFLAMLAEGTARYGDVDVVVAGTTWRTRERTENNVRVAEAGRITSLLSQPVCPAYAKLFRRRLPGIVHVHEPNPLADLAVLASKGDWPLVVTYHSDVVRQRVAGLIVRPALRRVLRRSRAVVTTWPGQAAASPVLRDFTGKCRTIPLGVDPAPFSVPRAVDDLPPALAVEQRPFFAVVGRLVWYKGLEVLLHALKETRDRCAIAFVGAGPLERRLKGEAAELGVDNLCHWLGDCSDRQKVAVLLACRGLVLPSTAPAEVFGVVQLEAMCAGKAVVNTSLPTGVPWVARDGKEAITVPPGDAPALAEAMRALLADEGTAQAIGAAGRRRVEQNFTSEAVLEQYLSLYRSL